MTIDNRLPESTLCPSLSLSFTILTDFTVGGSSIDAIIYAPGEGRQCAQEVLHLHLLAGHDQLLQSPVTAPALAPAPAVSCHWGWWSITSTVLTPSSGVTRTPPAGPRKPHSGRRGNFANIRYNLSSVQRWHSWRACRQFFETKPLSGKWIKPIWFYTFLRHFGHLIA